LFAHGWEIRFFSKGFKGAHRFCDDLLAASRAGAEHMIKIGRASSVSIRVNGEEFCIALPYRIT
jgi:hypothetical protein